MRLCATCKKVKIQNKQRNCQGCKDDRKRAYNLRRYHATFTPAAPRLCECGCGKLAGGGGKSKYTKACAHLHNLAAKRERSRLYHKSNHKKPAESVTAKKKKQQTEAQIDARAIAITKENRRVELELAERAARLPSHLIAARVMRGVCASVLY